MTINKAMQLEEVNNELITVLLGLTARVRTAVKMLKECDHDHANVATLLSTFQAGQLLDRVGTSPEDVSSEAYADMALSELQGERYAAPVDHPVTQEELDAHGTLKAVPKKCQNPSCVDGLAPRKIGPEEWDVEMEPCPVCGGPNAN